MWIVVWGPPRSSKTTLAGWACYSIYRDWNIVLNSFVTSLPDLLHKIKDGLPEKWPTVTKPCHMRVPILNYDDFGAKSNKASTQHDEAWDEFKGGFDVIGRRLGVLIATMVDPTEPTFQLASKYTHELRVFGRGKYKYDEVRWEQDFKGWRTMCKKIHKDWGTFDPWPLSIYEQYDEELREDLTDEVIQRVQDKLVETHIEVIMKRIKPTDLGVLELITQKGLLRRKTDDYRSIEKETIVRLKSRNLIASVRLPSQEYAYDITDLGLEVLDLSKKPDSKQPEAPELPRIYH
jgi:hypothetical protein